MRYIENYTDEEILEMNEEQISALYDLQCARNGAPLVLSQPPVAPEQKVFEKDFEYYEVSAFLCDKETMLRVMSALDGAIFYDKAWQTEVITQSTSTFSTPTPTPNKGFSQQRYNEIKLEKEAYDALKKEYDEQDREYRDLKNQRADSIEEVDEYIRNARERHWKLETGKAEWARYMELSNQDQDIAMNFLKQRYDIDFCKKIVPSYFAENCVNDCDEAMATSQ